MTDEDPAGDADDDGNPNDDHDCLTPSARVVRNASCTASDGTLLPGHRWLVDEDGHTPIDQDDDGEFDGRESGVVKHLSAFGRSRFWAIQSGHRPTPDSRS